MCPTSWYTTIPDPLIHVFFPTHEQRSIEKRDIHGRHDEPVDALLKGILAGIIKAVSYACVLFFFSTATSQHVYYKSL